MRGRDHEGKEGCTMKEEGEGREGGRGLAKEEVGGVRGGRNI